MRIVLVSISLCQVGLVGFSRISFAFVSVSVVDKYGFKITVLLRRNLECSETIIMTFLQMYVL